MKAIVFHTYGSPGEVLALEDVERPSPGAGGVVVRVRAASINAADWHAIRGEPRIARLSFGLRRPKHQVMGCDLAGTVEAVGSAVEGFQPGDEVFGWSFMEGFGAFAEYTRVPPRCLVTKPAGLPFEQAAAIPLAGATALQGLRDHGRVEAGQRVLVVGASGGVGTFAVQLAKSFGAEVTAVCSTGNVELVRSLGADHVVDYTREEIGRSGPRYDLVLQVSGSVSPLACRQWLQPDGTLVTVSGDSDGRWIGALGRFLVVKVVSPFVSQKLTAFTVELRGEDLRYLADLAEAGTVEPVIDRTYPLADVPAAIRYMEEIHSRGKIVVTT